MKFCFFLKDNTDSISPGNGIKVTRNTRVRKQSEKRENLLTWNLQEVMTSEKIEALQKADQLNMVPTPSYVEFYLEPEE